ncbi:MAG: hypothetical protein A2068_04150 [Ignavibacteria bacterium GWB2_35_6b]|nr:MAG: hypothetical protein A2068_04150 [Ignavibacteria bacterium GWB2_35_6b]
MKNINKPGKRNFFIRILLPTLLTIILFIAVFFALFIPHFENTIMDRKREMIKELTNSAWSIIDKWHKAEVKGEVTILEAQEMAVSQIQNLRYGEEFKDYFWITDYSPVMIMHPYRPELNKKVLSNFVDSRGKKLFVEMADKAKRNGEGFVNYMWQWKDDSTKIVSKLSYVKAFAAWKWIIGTGIYVEDVKNEIAQLERKIINVSFGITLAISVLLFFIAYQNLSTEKLRIRAENNLHESKEKYRALAEASSEGLIMILEEGQIFYNKTFYKILGYLENEPPLVLSKLFVKPPKLKSFDINTLKITPLANNELDQAETAVRKIDGTFLNVLMNVSPISFLNNNGVVISVKDISINKKIEAELDESKEKYSVLTNQLAIGVFRVSTSKECRFVESNTALLRLLEIKDKDVLLETSLADYFENTIEFDSFFSDISANKSIQNRFVTLRKNNGSKLAVSISGILVKNENNEAVYLDGIIEDISEQNKTDKERDNLIYELQTAFLFLNNSVDKFIKPIPKCNLYTTAKDALKCLNEENGDCLLIEDQNNAIGFLTVSDIQKRILSNEENLCEKVFRFMSSPLITITGSSSIFDALIKFYESGINHLLYKNDNGVITGVIHSLDLQKFFHYSYLFFIRKIQEASTISELCIYHSQLMYLVRSLIERHVNFSDITKMTTTISDSIFKRVILLAVEKLGEPPVKFSYIVLGSAGRGEQTLATDQDNAIIYEDTLSVNEAEIKNYFLKLGEYVSNNLNQIGYDFCKGGIMAKNAKWCQPVSEWKKYFTNWVTTANPQDLLDIKIFFDLRHIYGDENLVYQLNEHITSLTSGYNSFFVYLSESTAQFQIPENALKLKSAFDIKMILLPIVDLIRLYALKKKYTAANTIERLEFIYKNGVLSKQSYKNIIQVYGFLMQKRFEHQLNMITGNLKSDNLINPHEISEVDAILFKKSFSVIEDLQNKLKLEFRGTVTI